jgi:hypothetical protein
MNFPKQRTIAIAGAFGKCSAFAFAVAAIMIGLQLSIDGVCCCLQSERED